MTTPSRVLIAGSTAQHRQDGRRRAVDRQADTQTDRHTHTHRRQSSSSGVHISSPDVVAVSGVTSQICEVDAVYSKVISNELSRRESDLERCVNIIVAISADFQK